MDSQETVTPGQRRNPSTEDLVDWAHRHQQAEPTEQAQRQQAEPTERAQRQQAEASGPQRPQHPKPEHRATSTDAGVEDRPAQLFKHDQVQDFRTRWLQLQTAFVDEPRRAVQQADELVAEVMRTLAATFEQQKRELESQWRREGSVETEELRLALRRYRSFFDQLLHA